MAKFVFHCFAFVLNARHSTLTALPFSRRTERVSFGLPMRLIYLNAVCHRHRSPARRMNHDSLSISFSSWVTSAALAPFYWQYFITLHSNSVNFHVLLAPFAHAILLLFFAAQFILVFMCHSIIWWRSDRKIFRLTWYTVMHCTVDNLTIWRAAEECINGIAVQRTFGDRLARVMVFPAVSMVSGAHIGFM